MRHQSGITIRAWAASPRNQMSESRVRIGFEVEKRGSGSPTRCRKIGPTIVEEYVRTSVD